MSCSVSLVAAGSMLSAGRCDSVTQPMPNAPLRIAIREMDLNRFFICGLLCLMCRFCASGAADQHARDHAALSDAGPDERQAMNARLVESHARSCSAVPVFQSHLRPKPCGARFHWYRDNGD